MVGGNRGGDVLQHHRLAGARRRHDQRALALADRRDQVDHPGRVVLGRTLGHRLEILHLHLQPLVGIQRRQVVEVDAVAHRLGRLEIDRVDLQQREIALAVLGRADLALDRVAGAQAEPAHLARADIDVIRAGQVVGLRAAQEAEAVGQDFQRAFAVDRLVVVGEVFQDREHHVLLAQGRGVLDLEGFGEAQQVGRGFGLEFGKMHRRLVALIGDSIWAGMPGLRDRSIARGWKVAVPSWGIKNGVGSPGEGRGHTLSNRLTPVNVSTWAPCRAASRLFGSRVGVGGGFQQERKRDSWSAPSAFFAAEASEERGEATPRLGCG